MKKLLAILLSTMCAACAPTITKVNVPDMAKSDSLSVRDMRPASEKETKLFSLLITSKQYGIIREGDARLSPPPIRLLQHQVFEKFAGSGHLPVVQVQHFVVYTNSKSQLSTAAVFGTFGGALGAVVGNAVSTHVATANSATIDENAFDSLSGGNEYQRGLFTLAENPQKASVFIVYIETDIDGRKVFTRTVSSIKQHGDDNPRVMAVESAIADHLAHYGSNISTVNTTIAAPAIDPSPVPTTPASAMVSAPAQPAADTAVTLNAQNVANQLGCGMVKATGNNTYVASCSDYGVAIDCDGGKCHPTHTVRED